MSRAQSLRVSVARRSSSPTVAHDPGSFHLRAQNGKKGLVAFKGSEMKTTRRNLPRIRIGISGWTYPPWRGGKFYPKRFPQKRELEYASRQVNSIEINGSFYSLQRPESYFAWYQATPEDFVFVYFDNDVKVRAPFDAMSLACRLGLGPAPAKPPRIVSPSGNPRRGWPPIERRWNALPH